MRISTQGPGYVLRPFREWPVAYAFRLDDAPAVLGVGRAGCDSALRLLEEAGDLFLPQEADRERRLTTPIRFPDGNRRMVVCPGYRERLQLERRVRAVRYDSAERIRAA